MKPQPTQPTYTAEVLQTVRRKGDKFSLTDLWKSIGSPENKTPSQWSRTDEAQSFLKVAAKFLNVVSKHKSNPQESYLIVTARGKAGGTWGVEQVFLEYAQYLDPALAVLVNQVFIERIQEESNPELAIQRGNERARKTWAKQGKPDRWIEERIQGVAQRKAFTGTLVHHGVRDEGFKNCTNAIYNPLFGGTADVVRHKKNLEKGVSIRDNMSQIELAGVRLAELLATEKIENQHLQGNAQCELACTSAARSVASAIIQARKN